jgi:hypothetical protein
MTAGFTLTTLIHRLKPILRDRCFAKFCASAIYLLLATLCAFGQTEPDATLLKEVAAARDGLKEHPKFKKFYEHLAANPDSLPTNGPKLAALLAAEAKSNATIREHQPSLLATWQEVARLATAGNDYKLAFPALDSLQKDPSKILTPAAARLAKGQLLAAAAEVASAKPIPGEREAVLELVRGLLKDAIAADDVAALPSLLVADAKVSWSSAESLNSIQLLLPLTENAAQRERLSAAQLLFDHLEALVPKTAAGKARKEAGDAIAVARQRFSVATVAQQAQQTLGTKPLDPAANQAYGIYLLEQRGKVRDSLTYLALGTDPDWKPLAAASLETKTAEEKVALADRWLATVKVERTGGKEFARHFYQEAPAEKSYVGIARAATEEKLKGLGPPPAPKVTIDDPSNRPLPLNEWVDLIPLVDFDQDLALGFWKKGPQNTLLINDKTEFPKLRLPVLLANCSYDLVVEFKLAEASNDIYLVLPVADRWVQVLVDAIDKNECCVFEAIPNGPRVRRNLLHANQAFRYEANVRLTGDQAQITFSINGGKVIEYKGPVEGIETKDSRIGTAAQPALTTFFDQALYTKCQVRALDGKPAIGRDVPLIKPFPASVLALKPTRLMNLRPLTAAAHSNLLGVSSFPKGFRGHTPIVGGTECADFLFAHAPSKLTYAIPPKSKYFTAVAYAACNAQVKFVVKVDDQILFTSERKPLDTVCIELPEGAKVLQLECDDLGDVFADHSLWCYPAFR